MESGDALPRHRPTKGRGVELIIKRHRRIYEVRTKPPCPRYVCVRVNHAIGTPGQVDKPFANYILYVSCKYLYNMYY